MDPLSIVLVALAAVLLVGVVRGLPSLVRRLRDTVTAFRDIGRAPKRPGLPTDERFRDVGDPPRGDRPDPYA